MLEFEISAWRGRLGFAICNHGESLLKKLPLKRSLAVVVLLAVASWMLFRPDRAAALQDVAPGLLASVASALPQIKSPTSATAVKLAESSVDGEFIRQIAATAVSPQVVRKSSRVYFAQNSIGVLEEATGLYLGPVQLVRHTRKPMPFIGDLLPGAFWVTTRLSKFEAQPSADFPWKLGSTFSAAMSFDRFSASGDKEKRHDVQLNCQAYEQIEARTIHATLSGKAMKVKCEETGREGDGDIKVAETSEWWYLDDLQLSISARYDYSFPGDGYFPSLISLVTKRVLEVSVIR